MSCNSLVQLKLMDLRNFINLTQRLFKQTVDNVPALFMGPSWSTQPSLDIILPESETSQSLSPMEESIWYAVPKKRKSVEVRLRKKLGFHPYYENKLFKTRIDLLTCHKCGNSCEAGRLCPHCYSQVMKETAEMQDKIMKKIEFHPISKEVHVTYDDDELDKSQKGKLIVEMKKKRPSWFARNLKEKTTQPMNTNSAIVPPDLN